VRVSGKIDRECTYQKHFKSVDSRLPFPISFFWGGDRWCVFFLPFLPCILLGKKKTTYTIAPNSAKRRRKRVWILSTFLHVSIPIRLRAHTHTLTRADAHADAHVYQHPLDDLAPYPRRRDGKKSKRQPKGKQQYTGRRCVTTLRLKG